MIGHDLGHQGQAEPTAAALAADEGLEQVVDDVEGHADAVVAHLDRDRQLEPCPAVVHGDTQAMLVLGRQRDGAIGRGRRLGGVLDQVQEHLHQAVPIALHLRQGRVVELDHLEMPGEAGLRDAADMLEHLMDVDRAALHRRRLAELLHAIDQRADPVGLLTDQADQRSILLRDRRLEELGGPADAGKRVLDFMRQHGRKPGDRTGEIGRAHV